MNNNHNNIELHFTELTPDDRFVHGDIYTGLLIGGTTNISNNWFAIYCTYAGEELAAAKERFDRTFS